MPSVISPWQVAASLTELWSPRVVGEVDEAYIKVAKVQGSLVWHSHEAEDELFLVLKGHLRIELEDGTVELEARRERGRGADLLVFRVSDTGIGMSAEQLEKVFTRAFRSRLSTVRRQRYLTAVHVATYRHV